MASAGALLLFELAGRKTWPNLHLRFSLPGAIEGNQRSATPRLQRPGQRFGFLVYQLRRAHGLKVSRPQPIVNLATRGIRNTAPETNGELSAGKLGSRIGEDISNLWLVFPVRPQFYARPPAQAGKRPTSAPPQGPVEALAESPLRNKGVRRRNPAGASTRPARRNSHRAMLLVIANIIVTIIEQ